jgi:poly(beta-D-mannuronate) lyase
LPTRQGAGGAVALALLLALPAALPASTATAVGAGAPPLIVPASALAPSQFVVTRPGLVVVDPVARRHVLDQLTPDSRDALCGPPRTNWPKHGVQRNIPGDEQVAPTLALTMMEAAARYLAAGDADARDAIVDNLYRFAKKDAFSRLIEPVSVNHFYNLDRTLLPIISSFALVKDDADLDPAEVAAITRWLDRLAIWRGPEREMDPSRNNHRYLRDSVTMAWGAFKGDNALFFTGIDRFRIALEQMRDDGSLPLETDRGSEALFYQRHAIASLVAMAEIAAVQGYDLYAMQNQHGHDLHRIVGFLSNAIADPALIAQYTPEPQYLGFLDRRGHERHYMAWFEAYRARFPDSPITRQLQTQIDAEGVYAEPLLDEYAGGAMTCFFALPPLPANGEPAVEVLSDQGARERG